MDFVGKWRARNGQTVVVDRAIYLGKVEGQEAVLQWDKDGNAMTTDRDDEKGDPLDLKEAIKPRER